MTPNRSQIPDSRAVSVGTHPPEYAGFALVLQGYLSKPAGPKSIWEGYSPDSSERTRPIGGLGRGREPREAGTRRHTLYPYSADVWGDGPSPEAEALRDALRDVVAESPHDNLHLAEGPELLPSIAGMTTDLVHPGDGAFVTTAENLAARLDDLL